MEDKSPSKERKIPNDCVKNANIITGGSSALSCLCKSHWSRKVTGDYYLGPESKNDAELTQV